MTDTQPPNTTPLLQKPKEDTFAHHPIARVAFYFSIVVVVGVALYALIYAIIKSFAHEASAASSCVTAIGSWDSDHSDLAIFRGIPYALAPIGSLRWQPAQSRPCNGETIQAQNDKPVCLQTGQAAPQNEDCLYLNVYTRSLGRSTNLFPILVWIYGGGNVHGSLGSYSHVANWALNDDVCVVALNYRLNIFGYLALKELSLTDRRNVSGNYGITDLITGLQWIQTNAKAFGCDPTQVTLMGQSSGGTNIFALLASPQAKGLFHRAISLSGSPNITMDLGTAELQNTAVVSSLDCQGGTVEEVANCLRSKDANTVLSQLPSGWMDQDFWPADPSGLNCAGLVIVDGVTVNTSFLEALEIPIHDIPLLITSMKDEDELFAPGYVNITSLSPTEYNNMLQTNFENFPDTNTGSEIANFYNAITSVSVAESYYDLRSDIGVHCANVEVGILAAQHLRSPVYIGVHSQGAEKGVQAANPNPPLVLPFHGWDYMVSTNAWDLFTTMPNYNGGEVYTPTDADQKLGTFLQKQIYGLILRGSCPDLAPINSVPGFPSNYSVAVIGNSSFSSTVMNSLNFHSDSCDLLKNLDLNPDSRFWWVN